MFMKWNGNCPESISSHHSSSALLCSLPSTFYGRWLWPRTRPKRVTSEGNWFEKLDNLTMSASSVSLPNSPCFSYWSSLSSFLLHPTFKNWDLPCSKPVHLLGIPGAGLGSHCLHCSQFIFHVLFTLVIFIVPSCLYPYFGSQLSEKP